MKIPRPSTRNSLSALALIGLSSLALSVPGARAESIYWNAVSGDWATVGNWADTLGGTTSTVFPATTPINYFLTNGTTGSVKTTTLTGIPANRIVTNFEIGAFNTLYINGISAVGSAGSPRVTTSLNNAGLIQTGTAGTDFVHFELQGSSLVNSGTIAADKGVLRMSFSQSFNNTGGLLVANAGGTFNLQGSQTLSLTNGTLRSEVGGVVQVGTVDVQSKLRLNGTTVDNQGTFTTVQNYATATSGTRTVGTYLEGATALTNAVGGTVNLLNSGTGSATGTTVTQMAARFEVSGTASFNNQGLLNITNSTTRTGDALVDNSLVFSISSATATFQNTGTIQVVNTSTALGNTTQFTSVKSIVNEGTVRVQGTAAATASFIVTGSGNAYTQSGTGLRTLLERGGQLSAESIFIDSGDLGGVGTVTGLDTYIGAGARMVAADTLSDGAGAGVLTFNSHLTFDNNSAAVFALGADTATSGQVVLGAGFGLGIGSNVLLTLADLDGSATSGTYRLFELDGGSVTGTFILNTLPSGWAGDLVYGADFVDFTFSGSPIPEPSTYAMIFGGLVLGAAAFRRRRRSQKS